MCEVDAVVEAIHGLLDLRHVGLDPIKEAVRAGDDLPRAEDLVPRGVQAGLDAFSDGPLLAQLHPQLLQAFVVVVHLLHRGDLPPVQAVQVVHVLQCQAADLLQVAMRTVGQASDLVDVLLRLHDALAGRHELGMERDDVASEPLTVAADLLQVPGVCDVGLVRAVDRGVEVIAALHDLRDLPVGFLDFGVQLRPLVLPRVQLRPQMGLARGDLVAPLLERRDHGLDLVRGFSRLVREFVELPVAVDQSPEAVGVRGDVVSKALERCGHVIRVGLKSVLQSVRLLPQRLGRLRGGSAEGVHLPLDVGHAAGLRLKPAFGRLDVLGVLLHVLFQAVDPCLGLIHRGLECLDAHVDVVRVRL
mmetsp:Transcript_7468/g.21240  ORF Transcript_7468/g.21240 Transcript_7468/m.21240 type:complete len:360 (+) Transcript_7468:248-1327(+)